jgi:hypothetical protein
VADHLELVENIIERIGWTGIGVACSLSLPLDAAGAQGRNGPYAALAAWLSPAIGAMNPRLGRPPGTTAVATLVALCDNGHPSPTAILASVAIRTQAQVQLAAAGIAFERNVIGMHCGDRLV